MVRKANRGLRIYINYRKLNVLTKKDQYPLPLIKETLSRLGKAKVFTKINIRQAFHQIQLTRDENIKLMIFRMRFSSYKYRIVPFGLTNGPATFQRFINSTIMESDEFYTAYIDNILIYSNLLKEY